MKAAVSSVTPNGPTITHNNLTKIEVCVPADWSTSQAIQYAESKCHSISNYHWTTETQTDASTPCDQQHGFKHLTLIMAPDLSNSTNQSTSSIHEPINAKLLINIDDTRAEDILKTANGIQLVWKYLQVKAAAAKARTENQHEEASRHEAAAEHLNNQLLAEFPGTLVLV